MSTVAIPKSAPFPDEEIELLNRVVGAASPVQRAWLADSWRVSKPRPVRRRPRLRRLRPSR